MQSRSDADALSPRISTTLFDHLIAWLRANGVDVEKILRSEGMSSMQGGQTIAFVPLSAYVALFERAAEITGICHLGLKIGKIDNPSKLGILGTLFMSAPSLLEAYGSFSQNLNVLQEQTLNRISLSGNTAKIEYRLLDPTILQRRQDAEFSIAANASFVRIFSGGMLSPKEVHFEHECVGTYADYRDYFDCDIFFGQRSNMLLYDRDKFNVRNSASYPGMANAIIEQLEKLSRVGNRPSGISGPVEKLLGSGIRKESDIADKLGISVSTLIRQLKAEGLSFRDIALSERIYRAKRLLLATNFAVVDVALEVGYAESSSFTRAFRKMTGLTPRQYRQFHLEHA